MQVLAVRCLTAGTVYINWSAAGITYALRDANADGIVSLQDPTEVSAADLGSAATGPPALAPGMIFVNTCRRPSCFLLGKKMYGSLLEKVGSE